MKGTNLALIILLSFFFVNDSFARRDSDPLFFVKAMAKNAKERSFIANQGIAIDGVLSDAVTFITTQEYIDILRTKRIVLEVTPVSERSWGFPGADAAYHDYAETIAALEDLAKNHPDIVQIYSIGKSLEGRDLRGIRLSSEKVNDSLPTAVFMGCHHAREHLSVEIPLKLAQHLAENYGKVPRITQLLDTREIWIVPMVNPDGAEHDIATGRYKMWRKNRRNNGDGTFGVDLNRNYGKGWGGSGSSGMTTSETYRGTHAFSEPETDAVKEFLKDRTKATTLITYHTFSELVLWPWGHTKSTISNTSDRLVFEKLGKKMATWNGYQPKKSSDLYVASGDTTDWAYDELNIFAFTFELTPKSLFQGGFYPGAAAIEPTFKANLEPALYLIEMTGNPYRVLRPSHDPLKMLN